MSRQVKVAFDDEVYSVMCFEAEARGLTPSQYIRMTVISHINKYPSKGILADMLKRRRTTFLASNECVHADKVKTQ